MGGVITNFNISNHMSLECRYVVDVTGVATQARALGARWGIQGLLTGWVINNHIISNCMVLQIITTASEIT